MEFVYTKNNMPDLFVFFYKKGYSNIHKPLLSLIKIDTATRTTPLYHIGFKDNMGYINGNKIVSGVMVFEVLEGFPLQELMFNRPPEKNNGFYKPSIRSLEDLEPLDFYCIQKNNKDAYGDFVLKNIKFIDTKMTQSSEEFSRKIIATFVCTAMENFRIPYFFNYFKSEDYSNHIIRSKSEIDNILLDIDSYGEKLTTGIFEQCKSALNVKITNQYMDKTSILQEMVKEVFVQISKDYVNRVTYVKRSAIYKMRDFIYIFYKFKNEHEYKNAKMRGDLEFLNFVSLGDE